MRHLALIVLAFAAACGDDIPKFAELPKDSSVECTSAAAGPRDGGGGDAAAPLACPTGEVCLGGRCYPACDDNAQCADTQVCRDGVCVEGARPDAGPSDAGTDAMPDPCEGVMCETPFVCHPSGTCVECLDRPDCGPAAPICDLAYGTCRAFVADEICAPCNESLDCDGGRRCATIAEANERVCLPPCDMGEACPAGFLCDSSAGVCMPRLGTCTSIRNAIGRKPCMRDDECVPLGATVPPDICRGEDAMAGTPGVCVQLCGTSDQCTTGYSCSDGVCVERMAL